MMLARCSLPLPRSAGLGEQSLLLSSDDDDEFCSHGIVLHHALASCDNAVTLNSLQNVAALNGDFDAGLQPAAEAGLLEAYKEAILGSPGSDYLTEAYRALQDCDDIGENGIQLACELLQSDLDVACSIELSDSDDSTDHSALSDVASNDIALGDVPLLRSSSPAVQLHNLDDLSWSEMNKDEKERVLELITNAIRDRSNIREQLELLRLIGQGMTVLPTDSRFHIDPTNIDDEKLKSIREFLNQMAVHTLEANTESCKQQQHKQKELKHKKQRARHKSDRKRSNKDQKPGVKEKCSRLFDQEVVLTLQLQDDNDEEINVLD